MHKTGTTAFQQFCRTNRAILRQRGIWYPDYGPVRNNAPLNHHEFVAAFANENSERRSLSPREVRSVVSYWRENADGASLLLSSEAIARHKWIELAKPDWRTHRETFLKSLKTALNDFEVFPVIVIRDQDAYVRSAYLENIARASTSGLLTFDEYVERCRLEKLQFLDNLEIMERVLGSLTVLKYEELESSIQGAILSRFGFDVSDLPSPGVVRRSLGVNEARLKRHLNRAIIRIRPRRFRSAINLAVNRALAWKPTGALLSLLTSDRLREDFWATPADREAFLRTFQRENCAIRERYGIPSKLPARP